MIVHTKFDQIIISTIQGSILYYGCTRYNSSMKIVKILQSNQWFRGILGCVSYTLVIGIVL